MDHRTRVCLWIIVLGLANFTAYTIGYFVFIGGEAMNGYVTIERTEDGHLHPHYYVGHGAEDFEVSGGVWIYSAIHSTTVWVSVGAVLLAMLTLAKERIVSSMRSRVLRGRTFITVLATLITVFTLGMTLYFVRFMIDQLTHGRLVESATTGMAS